MAQGALSSYHLVIMSEHEDDPFGWHAGLKSLSTMTDTWESTSIIDSRSPRSRWDKDVSSTARELGSVRYEKTALIGEGGMGRVWLGWDTQLERQVAIKEPHEHGRALLEREAILTAKLEHPGIAKIHDVYADEDGRECFVMQLIRGETLDALVRGLPPLYKAEALTKHVRQLMSVCQAIAHAHARGLLHGDLSPRNVLVSPDDSTYVIDWGLARPLVGGCVRDPERLGDAGTPGFRAPEILTRTIALGPAADVWSLGALLAMIITGAPPVLDGSHEVQFSGEARERHPALCAIAARCLAADPARRYASAHQLGMELDAWFEGRRLFAYTPSTKELFRRTLRRHRHAAIVSLLSFVVIVITIAISFVLTRDEAQRARLAEMRAQDQAAKANRVLMQARAQQARRALEAGDTHTALVAIQAGLELGDHPDLRGLLLELWAISLPERVSTIALPTCAGRWFIGADEHTMLCADADFRVIMYRHGSAVWTYDPIDLVERGANLDTMGAGVESLPTKWAKFRRPDRAEYLRSVMFFQDARFAGGRVFLRDNGDQMHVIDARTGELEYIDERKGQFLSGPFPDRMSTSAPIRPLSDALGANPCDADLGVVGVRSRRELGITFYLCSDSSIWRVSKRDNTSAQLLEGGTGVNLVFEHSRTGAVYIATRSGVIERLAGGHRTLVCPFVPKQMIEVTDTPYVLVQGVEGSMYLFDHHAMQWVASLPPDTSAFRARRDGKIWLVRNNALEAWQVPTHPRTHRYTQTSGFASVSWAHQGEHLAVADGDGVVQVLEPLSGALPTSTRLGETVAKSVAPVLGTTDFYAITAGDSPLMRVSRRGERALQTPSPIQWSTGARRVASLEQGTLVLSGFGQHLNVFARGSLEKTKIDAKGVFTDISVAPNYSGLLAVNPREVWRLDASAPRAPVPVIRHADKRRRAGALRSDGTFALLGADELTVHAPDGQTTSRYTLGSGGQDVRWHPHHPWLVTTHVDGSVNIFRAHDSELELLARAHAHNARVSEASVHHDGRWLATVSWDATMALYDLDALDRTPLELLRWFEDRL